MEQVVTTTVITLQVACCLGLVMNKLSHAWLVATAGGLLLYSSLLGLGALMVVAASMYNTAALTAGATITLFMLLMISRPWVETRAESYYAFEAARN